ncbi:McrC family protein [Rhodococcus pyridinivorans]|uniref:McrC family protein n=1 Tax=Rhodococcus pyridinivorans TaxID=103816 RepID=UPI0036B383ED
MSVLFEHQSDESLSLTRRQAEELQQTGYVDVQPLPGDRWRVSAKNYVGTLVSDGLELLIRPKIEPDNLFLLLEPGLPANAWRNEAFEYGASSNLLPAVISFFARTVESTLRRGVLRSYEQREEALVALRGRPNLTGQFRNPGVLTPTSCSFDDFSENIAENRALRSAVRAALRVPLIDAGTRRRLMQQLIALEGVDDIHVHPESIDSIPFTRLNRHYAPALRLARLVLANLTLTDVHGKVQASSFMVDMNDLFQRFITERLRRMLRGTLDVIGEPTVHLGTGRSVTMLPDMVFRTPGGRHVYVADIKYKLTDDARARSQDYYQLLAYTTAMDLPEGMLIYCRRQDTTALRTVTVRNADKRLVCCPIDLTGTPEDVERELTALAERIATTAFGGDRNELRWFQPR